MMLCTILKLVFGRMGLTISELFINPLHKYKNGVSYGNIKALLLVAEPFSFVNFSTR